MTAQSALVLAAIVSAFVTFGIVLVWADFYTQRRPKQGEPMLPAHKDADGELPAIRRAA